MLISWKQMQGGLILSLATVLVACGGGGSGGGGGSTSGEAPGADGSGDGGDGMKMLITTTLGQLNAYTSSFISKQEQGELFTAPERYSLNKSEWESGQTSLANSTTGDVFKTWMHEDWVNLCGYYSSDVPPAGTEGTGPFSGLFRYSAEVLDVDWDNQVYVLQCSSQEDWDSGVYRNNQLLDFDGNVIYSFPGDASNFKLAYSKAFYTRGYGIDDVGLVDYGGNWIEWPFDESSYSSLVGLDNGYLIGTSEFSNDIFVIMKPDSSVKIVQAENKQEYLYYVTGIPGTWGEIPSINIHNDGSIILTYVNRDYYEFDSNLNREMWSTYVHFSFDSWLDALTFLTGEEYTDNDSDGIVDNEDNCPGSANADQNDMDHDGTGDACDNDRDGDGVGNSSDAFPDDASESVDTDGDGIGDNADEFPGDPSKSSDGDGDSVDDSIDNCPTVSNSSQQDSDGDSIGNACDDDRDGDGVNNSADAFPDDASESSDNDGDGVGNNTDFFPNDPTETVDSDGDGVGDNSDAFPENASETTDSDGDGVGDNADAFPNDPTEIVDSDGDGVGDNSDVFPENASEWADSDGDGVGDNTDVFPNDPAETEDGDGDGVGDNADAFPNDAEESEDIDGDGIGDNTDTLYCIANTCLLAAGHQVGTDEAAEVEALLAEMPMTLTAADGEDLVISSSLNWISEFELTLQSDANIQIDSVIDAGPLGSLVLNTGVDADYIINVPMKLPAGPNFTAKGQVYTVITQLGDSGDENDGVDDLGEITLQGMAYIGNLSGHFVLGADIDATDTLNWNGGAGFSPIGSFESDTRFSGELDGLGYAITGLFIYRPNTDYVGLFGITNQADVANISLSNIDITGDRWVGGLAGFNGGTIKHSHARGNVTGRWVVGGLAGVSGGTISKSYTNAAVVEGLDDVGGLVGENSGTVSDSYSNETVSKGRNFVGGLVGRNGGGVIRSYASGTSTGSADYVGGLVGINFEIVNNSYSSVSVNGGGDVGGLVGRNVNEGIISSSYASGMVIGDGYVGGLIGRNFTGGNISASLWSNDINPSLDGVGNDEATATGAYGKTEAELKRLSTYTIGLTDQGEKAWDISADAEGDSIWYLPDGFFPVLRELP
jgi:thrombospondin type 3 repeat protein